MENSDAARAEQCIERADTLALLMSEYARGKGATAAEAERLSAFARCVIPIVIWQIDNGEIAATAEGLWNTARLFAPGAAVAALRGRLIPGALRQPLLSVLQPTRVANPDLIWWDDCAIPTWLAPFCEALESSGALDDALRAEF